MIVNRIFNYINRINDNIVFITPHLYSVGDASEILMFGLIKAKHDNKKLFILSPYDSIFLFGKQICNNALFLLESKYIYKQNIVISTISKIFVTIIILPSRLIDRIMNIFDKQLAERRVVPLVGYDELWATSNEIRNGFSWNIVDQKNWFERINYIYDLSIDKNKLSALPGKMADLGIDPSSWFVCLHVRESGFRKDEGRREYRNSSIFNYLPAIIEIIKAGGIVVRMGDSTMTPLPEIKNLIDYPFTEHKSALMDLQLIRSCRFFIGTDSGIMDTAKMFRKDTLITNMVGWISAYPLRKKDRGIYKYVFHKPIHRYLTLQEILNDDWSMQALFGRISDDYELVENTPEDIKDGVLEYLDCHNNNNFSLSENQIKLNYKRVKVAVKIFEKFRLNEYVGTDEEVSIRYKIASRINNLMDGSICNSYINKYLHTSFSDSRK